jgi:polyisoprenoid-binding protein YceI
MKLNRKIFSLAFFLTVATAAQGQTWKIDSAHSVAHFKVRHMLVTWTHGTISGIQGTVTGDEKDITKSKVSATLNPATINTNDAKRDEHLKSPDFLNVTKYPTMTFESKSVTGSPGNLKITGALTLNGVTKDVVLDVEGPTAAVKSPFGDSRRGLSAKTKINRKDFNIVWNKAMDGGGVVVGDDVEITIDLELTDKV